MKERCIELICTRDNRHVRISSDSSGYDKFIHRNLLHFRCLFAVGRLSCVEREHPLPVRSLLDLFDLCTEADPAPNIEGFGKFCHVLVNDCSRDMLPRLDSVFLPIQWEVGILIGS